MRVAVFGAKGRTGRLGVEALGRAGHTVVAASRWGEAVEGATAVAANPATSRGVEAALEGCEAVVNAIASGKGNLACSALARALSGREGLRYVSVGGAAVGAPGDKKGIADRAISWISRQLAGKVVRDRQAEFEVLRASKLRWTMMRPPRLVDGAAQGKVRLSFERPPSIRVTRPDLAQAVLQALGDDILVGRPPS